MSGLLLIEVLLAAIGVALNPPAVVAAIVLAATSRRKALAFAGGWLSGLILAACLAVLLEDVIGDLGGTSVVGVLVKLAVGAALLVLAVIQWRKHKTSSDTADTPPWMASIAEMPAPRAFAAAAAYAALNPKTLAFVVAGTLALVEGVPGLATQIVAAVLFAAIASVSVTAPVVLSALAPRRFGVALDSAGRWLGANGSLLTAALFAVLGAMLVYSGVTALLGMA